MGKVPALHPQGPDFGPPRIHIEAMYIVCVGGCLPINFSAGWKGDRQILGHSGYAPKR